MNKKRIVIAASGGGRSLKNLLNQQNNYQSYQIAGLITSSLSVKAVNLALEEQLPIFFEKFSGNSIANEPLLQWLETIEPDYIVLAGFLKKFPTTFPKQTHLSKRIINIHPALLPKFGGPGMFGIHVHKAVLAAGEKESGATVHFVDAEYDQGSIVEQIKVPVEETDTPEMLASRVFQAECHLFPKVVDHLCRGETCNL